MKKILTSVFLLLAALLTGAQDYASANYVKGATLVRHEGYTSCYSHETLCPVWVGWELTSDETWGAASRTDEFSFDPAITKAQAAPWDYSRSGYDRGHMAPAADMKWSAKAMEESFYMTNICPQDNDLNAGVWLATEKKCRYWAKCYGKVWIVCGPVFSSAPRYIGREHKVRVPDAFFKCVLKQHKDGSFESIAFLVPNKALGEEPLENFIKSLQEIESVTGLSFFQGLPVKDAKHIRNSFNKKYWKW